MNEEAIKKALAEQFINGVPQPSKTTIWMCEHPVATAGIVIGGAAVVGGVIGFLLGRVTAN